MIMAFTIYYCVQLMVASTVLIVSAGFTGWMGSLRHNTCLLNKVRYHQICPFLKLD